MTPQDLKQISALIDRKMARQTKVLGSKVAGLELEIKKVGIEVIALGSRVRSLEKVVSTMDEKMAIWKSEIVDAVDVMAKEIRDEREFRTIVSGQIVDTRRRMDDLETKVFGVVVG